MTIRNIEHIDASTSLSIDLRFDFEDEFQDSTQHQKQGMNAARQTFSDEQAVSDLAERLSVSNLRDTSSEMGTLIATSTPIATPTSRYAYYAGANPHRIQAHPFRSSSKTQIKTSSLSSRFPSSKHTTPPQSQTRLSLVPPPNSTLFSQRPTPQSPLAFSTNITTLQSTPEPAGSSLIQLKIQSTLSTLLLNLIYLYNPSSSLPAHTPSQLAHTLSASTVSAQLAAQTFNVIALSNLIASILLESCAPCRDEEVKRVEQETRLQGEERCGGWDEEWILLVAGRWEGVVRGCLDDVARYKDRARRVMTAQEGSR